MNNIWYNYNIQEETMPGINAQEKDFFTEFSLEINKEGKF